MIAMQSMVEKIRVAIDSRSSSDFLVIARTDARSALGLLAKPMLVTLPFVLALLEIWPLARLHRGWRPLVRPFLPFLALSALSCGVTLWAQRAGGAVGTLEGFPLGARLANAAVSASTYLGQFLWPAGLATPYPYRWETIAPGRVLVSLVVVGALTAAAIL